MEDAVRPSWELRERASTPARPHRWLRRVAVGLGAVVVLAAVAFGVAVAWVRSEAGRRWVARKIEAEVSSQVRGTIRVGEITEISRTSLRARNVRVISPDGDTVIAVRDVSMDIRWRSLAAGRFASTSARVRGGTVRIAEAQGDPSTVSIELAFRGRGGDGGADRSGGDSPLSLRRMVLSDLTVTSRFDDLPDARGERLAGTLDIVVPRPGAAARLHLRGVRMALHVATPLPLNLTVTDGRFDFDGDGEARARVDLRTDLGRLETDVIARPDGPRVFAHATLRRDATPFETLPLTTQAFAADIASQRFTFDARREGAP
ncbi:MAG: hypothetical protein R3A52_06190 [Polyangiales bacterium]